MLSIVDISGAITKSPATFGVGPLVNHFTGREEELSKLKGIFYTKSSQCVVLTGLPGIGKTELTKNFISLLPPTSVVTWLSGDTPDKLRSSLSKMGKDLGLSPTELSSTDIKIIHRVEALQTMDKEWVWVVVVDKVGKENEYFDHVARTLMACSQMLLVLTSRRRDILITEEMVVVEISEPREVEAIHFVKSQLGPGITGTSDVVNFCRTLNNLPLCLGLTVSYITQQRRTSQGSYNIIQYLNDLNKKLKLVMESSPSTELEGFEKLTLAVWDLTIDKIKSDIGLRGQLACTILDLLAFVNGDGIDADFLKIAVASVVKRRPLEEEYTTALRILSLFSLVKVKDSFVSVQCQTLPH